MHYVENIRRYYDTLSWMDEKAQAQLAAQVALEKVRHEEKQQSQILLPPAITPDEKVASDSATEQKTAKD